MVIDSLYFPGGSVVFNYQMGADRWVAFENLYAGPEGYLYLPQFAMIFSILPDSLVATEIIWNLFQLVVVVSGLYGFSRMMSGLEEKSFFPLLSVVVLIISWTTIRNGQATMLQLGVMLWTSVSLYEKKWNLAAFLLVAGLISKPVFIIFFALVVFFYSSLYWRIALWVGGACLFPVLFKGYEYAINQHVDFVSMVYESLIYGESGHKTNWAHFFAIFPQLLGVSVSSGIQVVTRLIVGLLVLWGVAFARKRYASEVACYYLYALAACYLMLFNPRTETNSFALIAPAIGYWVAVTTHRFHDMKYHLFCWLFVISFPFAKYVKLLTPGMWAWGKPMITVFFSIFLIWQLCWKDQRLETQS
ncbi:MAG: hypothetical protein QS748_12665 [Candidatus Endonucleobacter bathymodioli]|uniref:DUF2029 domain-containing protein n=1 Tax=Candidatus Endonucleibacter bathymodioli TaxID=539814 RepID=A0AA90SU61_9GAMM|nr:hypothetical protein [Candidatus Endonucleobacter bathymodioli]